MKQHSQVDLSLLLAHAGVDAGLRRKGAAYLIIKS